MADASSPNATQTLDILIIGAGVSGIGMACHLRKECPSKSLLILERRQEMGGTWDLFRYPGIRSDSDMMTFGYRFAPWIKPQILADGGSIKGYVTATAKAKGVTDLVRFGRKAIAARWSSETALWTVEVQREGSGEKEVYQARFLLGCTGYYNYDEGFKPHFEGEETFKGQIVHPQKWPEKLDYTGKRVIVIGSGATAVTLVPSMAGTAAHVTMVQRSPSYFLPIPSFDRVSTLMQKVMPDSWVYRITRARNVAFQQTVYQFAKRRPKAMKRLLLALASGALASGAGYAIWYTALRGLTATRAAILQLSVPALAAAGGVGLLGEPLTPHLLGASLAVLGGVLVVILARATPAPPPPPPGR